MVAKRYEELEAWQLANELKRSVYALLASTPARDDWKFRDQITESAASGPANLAEGFGYYRHPEFAKHTRIAKASLLETQNHLGDGIDRGHWSADRVSPLLKLVDRAIAVTVRLLQHLETSDAPGTTATPRRKGTTFQKRERNTRPEGT
jgi:four helix bundle protein